MSTVMDEDDMSHVAFDERAQHWARILEHSEASRRGVPISDARPVVARRLGIAPGALERLRRGRVKGVRTWLYQRIRALVIEELHAEIRRQEHELFLALQCGVGPGASEIIAVQTSLAENKKILNEGMNK